MTIVSGMPPDGNIEPARDRVIQPDHRPRFRVQIDQSETEFTAHDLANGETVNQLRALCCSASYCIFHLGRILDLDDIRRQDLVRFLAAIQQARTLTGFLAGSGRQFQELSELAYDLLRDCQGVTPVQRGTQLAIEIIGLTALNEAGVRVSCGQIVQRLRELGIRDVRAPQLVTDAMAFREQRGGSHEQSVRFVLDIWADAPHASRLVIPNKWELRANEVCSLTDQDVFPCPIFLTRIFEDIERGVFFSELCWKRGPRWWRRLCPREQISNTRMIVELASVGLPVTSNNSAILVDYLTDFERENLEHLPTSRIANRFGWFNTDQEGKEVFLCGNQVIDCSQGGNLTTAEDGGQLIFHGEDDGDRQIAAGIRQGGSLQGWIEAVSPLQGFRRAMFALYAALASPVLPIVGADNFIVSFDGRTSLGKTTVLTVGASCWGYPILNGQDGESALFGWDCTRVFIERASAILTGLPLILDDTKVSRDHSDITKTIYQFASGAGRGRGSKLGVAATKSWKSVMLSSGEEPLTSFTPDGGSRARVLGLWGSPFPESQSAGQITVRLRETLEENYGFAGPALVQYLARNRQSWGAWRDRYRVLRHRFQQMAGNNAVAGRMADNFAVLELTAYLAHQAIEFPWPYQNTVELLWSEITADTDEANPGLAALRHIIAWSDSRMSDFEGDNDRALQPHGGWLGRWQSRGQDGVEYLAIYEHKLDEALHERNFSPAAIRRLWKDAGWLKTEDGKTTLRVRVRGRKTPVVALRWDAIHALMEGSEVCSSSSATTATTGNTQGPVGSC